MWPDRESEIDYLNFGEVSGLAVDILTSPGMLPVSVGVFGDWGAGKSSLLKLIESQLETQETAFLIVRFDAWLYQGYDDARSALLEVIATQINQSVKENQNLVGKTKKLLEHAGLMRMLGYFAEAAAVASGIPTGGMISKTLQSAQKLIDGDSLDEGDVKQARELVSKSSDEIKNFQQHEKPTTPPQQIDDFRKLYSEVIAELNCPLVVMIDNLDRCLPANIIHTLEAIRLFLFLPNTAFIIAADEDMIRGAVSEHFKGASERHHIDYVDKLIQVPIRLPKLGVREIRAYLFMLFALEQLDADLLEKLRCKIEDSLKNSWKSEPIQTSDLLELIKASPEQRAHLSNQFDLADRMAPLLANSPIIKGNPRIVKRLLNVVKMRMKTAKRRQIPLDENVLTKLVIFERCAGPQATADLYRLINAEGGRPEILSNLEATQNSGLPKGSPESWRSNTQTESFILDWGRLEPNLNSVDLRPAVYLSRETMPIGVSSASLSFKGRQVLEFLFNVKNVSSPTAKKNLSDLETEECPLVMDLLIRNLRKETEWEKKPSGFVGASLLADHSTEASIQLKKFVKNLESSLRPQPKWMKLFLKDFTWYQDN